MKKNYKKPEVLKMAPRVNPGLFTACYKLIFCLKSPILTIYNPFANLG